MKPLDLHVNFYLEAEEQLQKNDGYERYWKAKSREAANEIDFLATTMMEDDNE